MERTCVVIPAFNAALTIGTVVHNTLGFLPKVLVVNDGSSDSTADQAAHAGAEVLSYSANRGKGAALQIGLQHAYFLGFERAITLDADGQHCPSEIPKLLQANVVDPDVFVLGIRDLAKAGAPKANRLSNHFSNRYLSTALGIELLDTQCGMRCYPVKKILALNACDNGFAFEAEVLILAIRAKIPIVQVPIEVCYPEDRTTHFNSHRDPWKIVHRVLATLMLKN